MFWLLDTHRKKFFGWGGFISHPTGVLIMSTLYTPPEQEKGGCRECSFKKGKFFNGSTT